MVKGHTLCAAADAGWRDFFFFFSKEKVALCTEQLVPVSIIYIPNVGRQAETSKRTKDYLEGTRLEAVELMVRLREALNFNTAAHQSDTFFTLVGLI